MAIQSITHAFAFELRLLGLIGIFPYDKYRISFIAFTQYIVLMSLMGVQQVITIFYLETVDQMTDLLYVFGIYIVACSKLTGLVRNRQKVATMLDGLNEKMMFASDWNHPKEFTKAMRHVRLSSRTYIYFCYFAVLATIAATALNRKALFYCYFPFESRHEHNVLGYWLSYTYQVIYSIYLILPSIFMDVLTSTLLYCCATKLKVTRYECEKLCTLSKCIDNFTAIKTAAKFHVDTVRLIEDIERIFTFGLSIQCCLSVFSICIVMLKIIVTDFDDTEQFFGAIIALLAFVSQIFYYCHYGDQINQQSTELFTSIYMSKWCEVKCTCSNISNKSIGSHSQAIKRSISIMLERTKRPTVMAAGHFFKLTYETYIMICKTGYQSFAVLRDILK